MSSNIDLKKIWNEQEVKVPDIEYLYSKMNKLKKERLYKLIGVNLLCIITLVFLSVIWFHFQPELISTKIGVVLVVLAMLIYLVFYNRLLPLLLKNNVEISTQEYFTQLIKIKEKEVFQQSKMLGLYFVILSVGIGLYLFEYVYKMTIIFGVLTYSMTILWIVINWVYLRPIMIKKQNNELQKLLLKFHRINDQLND